MRVVVALGGNARLRRGLELIDGQAATTRELAELLAFLPRYNAALATLGPATKRLEIALLQKTAYGAAAVSAVDAAQAGALRRIEAETVFTDHARSPPASVAATGNRCHLTQLPHVSPVVTKASTRPGSLTSTRR